MLAASAVAQLRGTSMDSKRGRRRAIVGLLLLAAAVVIFFAWGLGRPEERPVLSLKLETDGSWTQSEAFQVPRPGRYRASLEIERVFPLRESECLAGVRSGPRPDCPPGFSPARMEWSLLVGGRPAPPADAFGRGTEDYSSVAVGRSLGDFELRPKVLYVVRARFAGASSRFARAGPRLKVAFDELGALTESALRFSALSLALASAGVLLLVPLTRRLFAPQGRRP